MTAGASSSELPAPQVLVFDVDGTLVDTLAPMVQALNEVLASVGLAPWPDTTVREYLSLGLDGLLSVALRSAGHATDAAGHRALQAALLQRYTALAPEQAHEMPGAGTLLRQARARGLRLAVCSNAAGPVLQALFARLGWQGWFDTVVHAGNAQALKPSGLPLRQVLGQMGALPAEAWLVGDSALDARCAQAAGCTFVWFSGGYGPSRPEGTAAQVDTLAAVDELLARAG
ncbi:MAG: HAD family hydrolase [Burkholderiales bacterium]|nr:HAD family hydrolase [Burkholderiales bacterium]